jgi:polyhydroxybutyrate depolymerase
MSATKTMAWLAAAMLVVACGGSGNGAPTGGAAANGGAPAPGAQGAGTSPAASPGDPSAAGPTAPACIGKSALQGDLDWTLSVGGRDRTVHVHLPKTYDPTRPTPVVLNFHGYTSNASQEDALSGMSAKADQAGFVAVHAEGIGLSQSWNAGGCCGEAASSAVDDVGFVNVMLDELESKLCVDARRVFSTGMSNGGFLSHRLACELSTRIAAVAPVAGVLAIPTCNPTRAMSVFQFHGTLDPLVGYNGSPALGYPSVPQTMSGWATRSGCNASPRETSKKGNVTCVTYDGCKDGAEVNLCTVDGGGHTWPGGLPVPSLGLTTTDINATDTMWDFFLRHPL